MNRTAEFVLALIGGICGIISGIFALMIGGLGSALQASGSETVSGLGWAAIVVSIIAIVFCVLLRNPSRTKLSGIILIICGIAGFICVSMFYILPGILIIISGAMCLLRKKAV